MTMTLIQHQELASAQSSIVFTDIPQTFTDLYVVTSFRTTNAPDSPNTYGLARVAFNTLETVTRRELLGNGSSVQSATGTTLNIIASGSNTTASTFSNNSLYIPNYTSSVAKSISTDQVMENNATESYQAIQAILWNNTASITSLSFTGVGGNLVAGSSATLYGITAGSDGIVSVS